MIKNFEVIKIDNNKSVVIDDTYINAGDWMLEVTTNSFFKLNIETKEEYIKSYNKSKKYKKIIASIGEKINGLPIIDINNLYTAIMETKESYQDYLQPNMLKSALQWVENGYMIRERKGAYTEQDIKFAVDKAFRAGCELIETDGNSADLKSTTNYIIESLRNKGSIKSIDIEVDRQRVPYGDDGWVDYYTPHTIDNDLLIIHPINIYYA